MAETITIGGLRYDVIADTASFEKSIVATKAEMNAAKRVFRETQTPAEKFGTNLERLNNLRKKGLITSQQYRRALEREKEALKKATQEAKKTGGAYEFLTGKVKAMAVGFAGLMTARAAIRGVLNEMTRVDELAKASRVIGVTIDNLQAVRLAAGEFAGMSEGAVDVALKKMVKRLGEAARGTGEAQKALVGLRLDAAKLAQLSPEQQFRVIAEAIRDHNDEAEQLLFTQKIFGDEFRDGVLLLREGGGVVDQYTQKIKALGQSISEVEAAQIEAANDAIARAQKSLQGAGRDAAVMFAPAMEKGARAIELMRVGFQATQDWIVKYSVAGSWMRRNTIGNTKATMAQKDATEEYRQALEKVRMETEAAAKAEEELKKQREAEAKERESAEAYLETLQEQADTIGFTREELELRHARQQKFTEDEIKWLKRIQQTRAIGERFQRKDQERREAELNAARKAVRDAEQRLRDIDRGRGPTGPAASGFGPTRGSVGEYEIIRQLQQQDQERLERKRRHQETLAKQAEANRQLQEANTNLEKIEEKLNATAGV